MSVKPLGYEVEGEDFTTVLVQIDRDDELILIKQDSSLIIVSLDMLSELAQVLRTVENEF